MTYNVTQNLVNEEVEVASLVLIDLQPHLSRREREGNTARLAKSILPRHYQVASSCCANIARSRSR